MPAATRTEKKRLQKRLRAPLLEEAVCRPFLTVSVLFLLFCALFLSVRTDLCLCLCAALFLGAFLSFCLFRRRVARLFSLLVLLSALLLAVSQALFVLPLHLSEEHLHRLQSSQKTVQVQAEVCEVQYGLCVLKIEKLEQAPFSLFVLSSADSRVKGDRFCGQATVQNLSAEQARSAAFFSASPSPFFLQLHPEKERALPADDSLLLRVRRSLSKRLELAESAPLLRAVLMADKSGIDPAVSEALSATGASHLLALSGLHLGLLVGSLSALLRRLFVGRKTAGVIGLLAGGFFVLLCGAPASLLRAFCMFFLAFLADCLRLRQSSVQSLFCALAILAFFDPFALMDLGLLFSALATLGILLFVGPCREGFDSSALSRRLENGRLLRLVRAVLREAYLLFCTSLSALSLTLPVTALVFGEFSLAAPLWGILLIPLFTLFLYVACFLAIALCLGFSPAVSVLLPTADFLARQFYLLADHFADFSFLHISVSAPAARVAAAVLFVYVAFCLWYRVRRRICAAAPLVFFGVCTLCTATLFPVA